MAKVPAVTIDIADDGKAYTVTALPWPTIESSGQPYTARLVHTRGGDLLGTYPTGWTADKLAAFVRSLLKTYPKVVA